MGQHVMYGTHILSSNVTLAVLGILDIRVNTYFIENVLFSFIVAAAIQLRQCQGTFYHPVTSRLGTIAKLPCRTGNTNTNEIVRRCMYLCLVGM